MELIFWLEETVHKQTGKCQVVISALQRFRIGHIEEKLDGSFRPGVWRKEYTIASRVTKGEWFQVGGRVPELDDEKEPARAGGRLARKTGGWPGLVMHKARQTAEQCGQKQWGGQAGVGPRGLCCQVRSSRVMRSFGGFYIGVRSHRIHGAGSSCWLQAESGQHGNSSGGVVFTSRSVPLCPRPHPQCIAVTFVSHPWSTPGSFPSLPGMLSCWQSAWPAPFYPSVLPSDVTSDTPFPAQALVLRCWFTLLHST